MHITLLYMDVSFFFIYSNNVTAHNQSHSINIIHNQCRCQYAYGAK